MRAGILFIVLLISFSVAGQQFQKKLSLKLDPGTKPFEIGWANVDNDSLLDIILTDTSAHMVKVITYSGLLPGPFKKTILPSTGYSSGIITAGALDQHSRIDFALSGITTPLAEATTLFSNRGKFIFQKPAAPQINVAAAKLIFSDLTAKGKKDAVLLKNSGTFSGYLNARPLFTPLFDSANFVAKDFAVFDFDGNGFNDIVVSGKNNLNQIILKVIELKNNVDTLRTILLPAPIFGAISIGDLDHDGLFDIVVAGEDASNTLTTRSFINKRTTFEPGSVFTPLLNPDIRIADFDSDGKADISFRGLTNSSVAANWIKTNSGDSIVLPTDHVLGESYGDYDKDGDLDLLQLTDTLGLVVWENQAPLKNKGPAEPIVTLAFQLYTRLFMYWNRPLDDHTPSSTLTFDLTLYSADKVIQTGEFDSLAFHRLSVTHGNQGTHNFGLLKTVLENYSYKVQAIDNSYSAKKEVGVCTGGVGTADGGPACEYVTASSTICGTTLKSITLVAPKSQSLWFSFSDGYLGRSDSMKIKAATDTIFSFSPQSSTCDALKIFLVTKLNSDSLKTFNKFTKCLNSPMDLTVEDQWKNVVWKTTGQSTVATGNLYHFLTAQNSVITATAQNDFGCTLVQKNNLIVSLPELTLNGDNFQIMAGQSVQLVASGAKSYQWSPPEGLSATDISDPVASPATTTRYTVVGTDSINCTTQKEVEVTVEDSAFVPNLFTPNGDGKNDELKIYGLTSARDFHLIIFNREGAVVFETKDVTSARLTGWNGTHNGTLQPNGLYYWKIEGTLDQGGTLQLNGKTKGSVLLVR
jgi:gliding motility-associated-like protein